MTNKIDYNELDTSALTDAERIELKHLLAASEERELKIPVEIVRTDLVVFPKDENGWFMKNDGGKYNPTEAQAAYINSNSRYVLFRGSRGSGKSAASVQKVLRKIEKGESGTIMNPRFEDFKTSTWDEFRRWIPPSTVIPHHRYRIKGDYDPQKPFTLVFRNGAKIYCKGLKDPNSARGANSNWLWYDEGGSDMTGQGWRIAIAAVRVGHEPQAFVSTTPNGIFHWLYDFFMNDEKQEEIKVLMADLGLDGDGRKLTEVFHGTMDENKQNLDPQFMLAMNYSYSGWQKRQEIEGEFVSQGGALGNSGWFSNRIIPQIPDGILTRKTVRYWDLAATEKKVIPGKGQNDPDKTVGTRFSYAIKKENYYDDENHLAKLPLYNEFDTVYFIENQVSGWWEWLDIKEKIWEVAVQDGRTVYIRVEQEPGSGGKNQVAELVDFIHKRCRERNMPLFDIAGHNPRDYGDKVMRANTWFGEAEEGIIYVIKGIWNRAFFAVLDSFGVKGGHDDEVDSVSGARITCAPLRLWKKMDFLHL